MIRTPAEVLRDLDKPVIDPCNEIVVSPDDWLVVCGGFEERSVGALERALTRGVPFNVLLIRYEPAVAANKSESIHSLCEAKGINIVELKYNRQDPAGFGTVITKKLRTSCARLFIDISGMSRLLIVQILVGLAKHPEHFKRCYVVYSEALTYPPTQEEAAVKLSMVESDPSFSVFFLSSGVYEVTLLPELSSGAPAGAQTRLVAFPSLDAHQLTALRAELQPSRLSLIEGIPPRKDYQWRKNMIADVNRLSDLSNTERYSVSTLYYEETLSNLLKIYEDHGLYERILISPTGSKMQTVAVGLLRAFLEDIQIVYPTPTDFLKPEKYTHGIGQMHLLSLEPFAKH